MFICFFSFTSSLVVASVKTCRDQIEKTMLDNVNLNLRKIAEILNTTEYHVSA